MPLKIKDFLELENQKFSSYKEKYLQSIASFLIVLVLTIPFYTISVYATINKASVKGSDDIGGFAKLTDFLNFNVQASISNDVITNNQVVLGSEIKFDKCIPSIDNGSECTLRIPGNGTESFEVKSVPFTINLFKDDNTLDDSKTGSLTIDNKAPQVKLTASESKFSSQQDVVVNYDVTDFACDDPSCADKCVGIKNIEFFTSDGAFKQTIEAKTNDCNVKSGISIDPKIFSNGLNSVFAKATDKFGQISPEASVTFTIDNIGPSILSNSFRILRKGIILSTFSSIGVDIDVLVNLSGSDLNLNSVTADLSVLNPSQNLKNAKASCTSVENEVSTCKWSIELNPEKGGLKNIVINASDTSGNKESITISKLLSIDEKGPVVESLSTAATTGGNALGKASGNIVTAIFDDVTGLSADESILHVGGSNIKATSCSKEANWVCTWENINFGNKAQMSIQFDTTDILGNAVGEEKYVEVTVDSAPPALRSMNISNVGGLVQAFPGFFKIGDKIAVVANVTEDNDVFATADFSRFISEASSVAGSCERMQADEHICTWLTDSINLEAKDAITFNFSDNAGNTLIVTRSLRTFGLENATVPDFWANGVSCSPKTVDRNLGSLINQRIFCQVNLKQKSTTRAVSTVFIGPASCSGDTSIVDSVETFNTEVGSTSPVIRVTLRKDDFKINNASLSCSFNIFSRIGSSTTITRNPEIENAKINIGFFNLPLGELSNEVNRKIKDAKDDAQGIFKIIGTLNKLVTIAKKICQLINAIYNIITMFYVVVIAMKGFEKAACTSGWGNLFGLCEAAYGIAVKNCGTSEIANAGADGIKGTADKFCKYVNCQAAPWILGDWQNFMKEQIDKLPGAKYFPGPSPAYRLGAEGKITLPDDIKGGFSAYMNPQTNLIVATMFACLPGIIYGLDKYRQIKCLYADCLENAVGREGLPVTACEDLKAFSTCKYVYGEIFALIPYTAVLDHFLGIIKGALSNPFAAIGVAVAVFCKPACLEVADGGAGYQVCRGIRLLSLLGDTAANVKNIIDEGFKVNQDYCLRLEFEDEKKPTTTTGASGFTQVKTK